MACCVEDRIVDKSVKTIADLIAMVHVEMLVKAFVRIPVKTVVVRVVLLQYLALEGSRYSAGSPLHRGMYKNVNLRCANKAKCFIIPIFNEGIIFICK